MAADKNGESAERSITYILEQPAIMVVQSSFANLYIDQTVSFYPLSSHIELFFDYISSIRVDA